MKKVGLRELKNRLSKYVRDVRAGRGILVTDRGQVVAELRPPGSGRARMDNTADLSELVRRGALTLGAPNKAELYPPMPCVLSPGATQRLLDEERGGG